MKQDIVTPAVTNVIVAVAPRDTNTSEDLWDIYVINLRKSPMENVLITSQGYGQLDGKDKTTTVLRHFHQSIAPGTFLKVEPIQRELFGIQNEYWISFNDQEQMLDKRFVFKAGQISEAAFKQVPVLGRPGVMIL